MRQETTSRIIRFGAPELLALLLMLILSGCGAQPDTDSVRASGTVSLALSATAHGHTYELRHATFVITGLASQTLSSDDQPDAATLSATLATGQYNVALAASPEWQLWRDDAVPVHVKATLVSPSSGNVPFTIAANAVTPVVFRFMTDGTPVTFGETGSVVISTEVDDGAAGAGGEGGGASAEPTCSDAVKNGQEGDIDCGGPCVPCANYRSCNVAADCQSLTCEVGACLPLLHLLPGNLPLPYATSDNPPPLSGSNLIQAANPIDACAPLEEGSLTGTVALVERGSCTFYRKAINAQNAGALGAIIFDNLPNDIVQANLPGDPPTTIPVIVVTQQAGAQIQALLGTGVTRVVWDQSP